VRLGTGDDSRNALRNIWNTETRKRKRNEWAKERRRRKTGQRAISELPRERRTVVGLLGMRTETIQRVHNPQAALRLLHSHASLPNKLLLRLTREREMVDPVAKVVLVASLEVRDEIVHVHGIGLERASGREVEVADDFVHADLARDVAAFLGLLLDLVGPSFGDAL